MTTYVKTLEEVSISVTDGTHYSPMDVGSGHPFLTVKDMHPGGLDFAGCARISNEDFAATKRANAAPVPGDVLFSKDGTVGKVAVVPRNAPEFSVLSSIAILRPNAAVIDSAYLSAVLSSPELLAAATRRKTGSAVRRIILSDLKRLPIPLPPLAEQRRIAAILDQADELRSRRRSAVELQIELVHAIFDDMFTEHRESWPVVRLDALIDDGDHICYGVVQPGDAMSSGIPLVRVGDLADGRVSRSDLKLIAPEIERAYSRSRLRGTEILVSCVGSIGKIATVEEADVGSNIARAVARVPVSEKAERTYVAAALRSPSIQSYFESELRTVSQPTLNLKQLSGTMLALPPRSMQLEFRQRVERANALKTRAQKHLATLDELFAALQARAFAGHL